ncbi:MAG: hypothetical protein IPM47_19320 [Sphingobacteriales bacterium]|nr:MAG: hypothetical protein IPM47_19320 [Sphingobacteriales bacterium]
MLTKKRLPLLITLICCLELSIYLWATWTSTLDRNNFFAIQPEFIFDKCARLAGRVSSFIILSILLTVGFYGLKNIYGNEKLKVSFLILITLFTCNHLIHLLFVILRFISHGESLALNGPVEIGGTIHGIITFTSIVLVPVILWKYKNLNNPLYIVIILFLLNISSFIVKTFLGKIKPPEHPAYHNQLGIVLISAACIYVLLRVYQENKFNTNEIK